MQIPLELPKRIRDKIDPSGDCWVWIAARDPHGYGRVRWEGKVCFAHRVVYSILAGDPGDELDHLCRTPSCVRPSHLDPVTHRENVRRGRGVETSMAVRAKWAEPRDCPRGHSMTGDNLYIHHDAKRQRINRQCRTCRRDARRQRRAAGLR